MIRVRVDRLEASDGANEHASEKFSQYSPVKITDVEEVESLGN